MNAVWEHGPEDRAQLLLMLALADFANDAGECWPSINSLATKARMVPRTVIRSLKALESDGWLSVLRKTREHRGNSYLITTKGPVSGDSVSHDKKSHDKKSHDKSGMSQVTNRAKSGDKSCNFGHPINNEPSRTVKEPPSPFAKALDIWNRNGGNTLTKIRSLGSERRKKLSSRFAEAPSPETFLSDFERAVELCATTPFLQGKNPRSWTPSFDWLIKNDGNLSKVLEGTYGKPNAPGASAPQSSAAEEQAAEFRRRQMSVVTPEVANG
jgi:hypothetical protein